ncbi:MAG: YebC/PmpR family DNA-binding transcriptional regulator [Firmicutes bacterium]|nr:YebC/PmpR family DNA-binding transcriptional regulator [Candidatus Fiminaster equi]
MGRHHEVRAAAMAKTGAMKSALYARASKEAYMAARTGDPDPKTNLALRAVYDKYRGKSVPRDVFDRAIKKAQGGDAVAFVEGRYEAFGPGNSLLIVDTLTDNPNRALVEVRTQIVRKGGHLGSVMYNFTQMGILSFKGDNRDAVEEALILGDVDVQSVEAEDGYIYVQVSPEAFAKAKDVLAEMNISEFDEAEVRMEPNEWVTLDDESKAKFQELVDALEECEDVQNVAHNVEL